MLKRSTGRADYNPRPCLPARRSLTLEKTSGVSLASASDCNLHDMQGAFVAFATRCGQGFRPETTCRTLRVSRKGDTHCPPTPVFNSFLLSAHNCRFEPEWCVPLDRGFQWWPGSLSQRVWADPVKQVGSHEFSRLHIESDLLRNVDESQRVSKFTAHANRLTTVSADVFHPGERHIRLHSSICVSEENLEAVLRLASTIAYLQASDLPVSPGGCHRTDTDSHITA